MDAVPVICLGYRLLGSDMSEQSTETSKPTHAAVCEEKFISDLSKAIRAWREAGKPHKR